MQTRRDVVRSLAWLAAGLGAAPLLAASGRADDAGTDTALDQLGFTLVSSDVPREAAVAAAVPDGVACVQALTGDLYRRLAAAAGNVVVSPYSVAVALAMTRYGAAGTTASEMDAVLHAPSLPRLGAGMNSLSQLLGSRAGERTRPDQTKGMISLQTANSLWGQRDMTWQRKFIEALGRRFGAGMRLVDYIKQTEAARRAINGWTAEQTRDRIPQILPAGILDALTRLVLVNAIYFKAPWQSGFQPSATSQMPFRRGDGVTVNAQTMSGGLHGAQFASGSGWRGARVPYVGGQLAMSILLPDGDRAAFERSLDGAALARMLDAFRPVELLQLRLPKWKFRQQTTLENHLAALGMPSAFGPGRADFSGMTTDADLYISAVLHEAFIAVDEEGTEATAATAVVSTLASSMPQRVELTVDRPFIFVIHDVETVPLFIGRVDDPTSTSD